MDYAYGINILHKSTAGSDEECYKPCKVRFTKHDMMWLVPTLLICIVVQVWAIVDASQGRTRSKSFQADIVLSVLSPIFYWILKIAGVLGVRTGS